MSTLKLISPSLIICCRYQRYETSVLTMRLPVFQTETVGMRCQICYVLFRDQSAINAHYDTAHSGATTQRARPGEGAHACDVCDKRYVTKQSLRQHMTSAHGLGEAQKFTCGVCSRDFSQKSTLNRHIKLVHKIGV